MTSYINTTSITHAPDEISYFHRFSVFMWTSEYAVWTCIFENGEKNISVFKNIRIRVDRASEDVNVLGRVDVEDGSKNVANKFAFLKNSVAIIPTRIKFQI